MFNIRGIDHIVLRAVKTDRMLTFYCDALGCTVERRQDEIGLIQLRAGSSIIDLVPVDGKLGKAGGAAPGSDGKDLDHFCLRVEPFNEQSIRDHLFAALHRSGPGRISIRRGRRRPFHLSHRSRR